MLVILLLLCAGLGGTAQDLVLAPMPPSAPLAGAATNFANCARDLWREGQRFGFRPTHAQLDAVLKSHDIYKAYMPHIESNMPWNLSVSFASKLAHFQHKHGITGSVGEIGTFYGKYFFSITTAALPEEPKVAIDLYENQKLNVDSSGGFVNSQRFMQHATNLNVQNLTLLSQDSATVTVDTFLQRGIPAFRLFSVDGSHTYDATMRDLQLAACSIKRAGVIVLDDWINMEWTGVIDASIHFLHKTPDIVPFLFSCNKLFMCNRKFHAMYYNWVISLRYFQCSANIEGVHQSRYELAGTKLCMDVRSNCGNWINE